MIIERCQMRVKVPIRSWGKMYVYVQYMNSRINESIVTPQSFLPAYSSTVFLLVFSFLGDKMYTMRIFSSLQIISPAFKYVHLESSSNPGWPDQLWLHQFPICGFHDLFSWLFKGSCLIFFFYQSSFKKKNHIYINIQGTQFG